MDLNKYTITQDDLHDLYILDKHQIILYTYGSGDILKFQINGKSKLIQSIFQLYYEQIQFIGDIGWICGENGAFYQTNDRGNFWNFKPISHNTLDDNDRLLPYAMHFFNENEGIISGFVFNPVYKSTKPFFYRTHDCGVSSA